LTLCPDNSKIIFARGFFLLLVNRHPVTIESPSAFFQTGIFQRPK
jgi:hypothetical protein